MLCKFVCTDFMQRVFEENRNAELVEMQRLEEQERRRKQEKVSQIRKEGKDDIHIIVTAIECNKVFPYYINVHIFLCYIMVYKNVPWSIGKTVFLFFILHSDTGSC